MWWNKVRLGAVVAITILVSLLAPAAVVYADPGEPTVLTYFATNVTTNSARLNGSLWSLEENSSAIVSFEWGPASDQDAFEVFPTSSNMTSPGLFYADIGPLLTNTTYYFRAKAVAAGTGYGITLSFKTDADTTPPAAVIDLSTGNPGTSSLTLTWTAPGDDGDTGTAAAYDIRYSTAVINGTNWNGATQVSGEPSPQTAGSPESFTVNGLNPGTDYYFVIKTRDESNNWSAISNCAAGTTMALPAYTMTVSIVGSGSVTKNPDQDTYDSESSVQLTAVPDSGWSFDSWSDDLTGNDNPQSITMYRNKFVTATFTRNTYSLSISTSGSGSITRDNDGPYYYGDVVQLSAVPDSGWSFSHWSSDLSGSLNPKSITLNGNKTVVANFIQNAYTLTVNTEGSGSVTRNPDQANYDSDTSVQLTAVPDAGWSFSNWSGDLTGSTNPQSVTMNGNKSVTATFIRNNDTSSPSAITDLAAGNPTSSSLTLTWTAPGDDMNTGIANSYDIRYSTSLIDESGWSTAIMVSGGPTPQNAGTQQSFQVAGLVASTEYYFAIKTSDEVPNVSVISNIASGTTAQSSNSGSGGSVGGSVGGGGVGPSGPGITGLGVFTNDQGLFNLSAVAMSEDGMVQLDIPKGVVAKNKDGNRLESITIKKVVDADPPPADWITMGTVYDFGPDGATFDPAITLSFVYDRNSLPQGLNEENMVVAVWDKTSGKWIEVGGSVSTSSGTITVPVNHFSRYTVIAHARPALFNISSLSVSPETVKTGETVKLSVVVTNQGDLPGNYKVALRLDDVEIESKELSLSGGSTEELSFSTTRDNPGTYNVDVNGLSTKFIVEKPLALATMKASNLDLSATQITAGETITISALITNNQDVTDTFMVAFKINGSIVDTKEVTLAAGANDKVVFTTSGNTAGTYSYDVAGLTGEFVVLPVPINVSKILNWWIIGAIISASVAVLTVAVLTLKRLRSPQTVI